MDIGKFISYLKHLGFSEDDVNANLNGYVFSYSALSKSNEQLIDVPLVFYYYLHDDKAFYDIHLEQWNKNELTAFVAVTDSKSYLINAKEKPNYEKPFKKNIAIATFDYGINSPDFDKEKLFAISKDGINSSYYFEFVARNRKVPNEVDKDLLLNLIELKENLCNDKNEKIIHLLILRCLFIKYLEDRLIFPQNYLLNILSKKSPEQLVNAFSEVRKINGDLFHRKEFEVNDIRINYINELKKFFESDYRSEQFQLFPYQFDKIPVQLISHVYEALLKTDHKQDEGIYYTPGFIVNFMLSQAFMKKLQEKKGSTLLDPACGSGSFLVEAFKMIIAALPQKPSFQEKVDILRHQLFGIDLDEQALQIAAFSLYLTLLEDEDPSFIKDKIKTSSPILPNLIGFNLICSNALTDNPFVAWGDRSQKFDCVITNPPWGSIPNDSNEENIKTKEAIGIKGKEGSIPLYKYVSDFQRSQAFLLRMQVWGDDQTYYAAIVNNSIFLNDKATAFRKDFLNNYCLDFFYELSALNKILFHKRSIGKVKNKTVTIGANEPSAVLLFKGKNNSCDELKYISPKLTQFSEAFEVIHFSQKDIKSVRQEELMNEDILWKIFVNGDWQDYQLIKQKSFIKDKVTIECRSGFQPHSGTKPLGKPKNRNIIDQSDFVRYQIKNKLNKFNWNQNLRRKPLDDSIFTGTRILVACEPYKYDEIKLRGIRVKNDLIFKDAVLSIKIKKSNKIITNLAPYLAIINSSFIGYYLYKTSTQWGKGKSRNTLRNSEIESLPIPQINSKDPKAIRLKSLVTHIEKWKSLNKDVALIEKEIDEIIFDLYGLLEYEKEIIREFFQINVERENDGAYKDDFQNYVNKFREVFKFVIKDGLELNAQYFKSNIGAAVRFEIVGKDRFIKAADDSKIDLLYLVKKNQLQDTFVSKMLNEEKIKIYEKECFYIVKSHSFKDWTLRQAINDANEEIGLIMKDALSK